MTYTHKMPVCFLVGLYLLFVWFTPGYASQTVEVSWPLAEGQNPLDVREDARAAGFVLGVVQEADGLLSVPMTEERKALFKDWITDKTRDLVLSYKELDVSTKDTPPSLSMRLSVRVNGPVLKQLLKDCGIFYTNARPENYSLTLSGLQNDDWQHLEDLQSLTGVKVVLGTNGTGTSPVMRLTKLADDRWQAKLYAFDQTFTQEGRSLDAVWFGVWKPYFHLPQVISGIFTTIRFKVNGWYVTDGVSYFGDILATWKKQVENVSLIRVDMSTESLGGVWSVQTLDAQEFRSRLETFLADRGLTLVFFTPEDV